MPNPDNIKKHKFKPGQTGNPNGRPKKLPEIDILLAEVLSEKNGGVTAAEKILRVLISKAQKGDLRAAEILLDRAYGKARQSIDHGLGGGLQVPIIQVLPPNHSLDNQ
jgi:hypothetical protein